MRCNWKLTVLPLLAVIAACSDSSDSSRDNPPAPVPENSPPMIAGLMDQSIEAGTAEQRVPFTVSDDSTPVADLMLSATSGDQSLVMDDGLMISGDGADRELLIAPQQNQIGMVEVTVRVQDGMSAVTEQRIVVSIDPRQTAFSSYLRTVFKADANGEPLPVNTVGLNDDGVDFNDLLR